MTISSVPSPSPALTLLHGREAVLQQICDRLSNPERLATSVVGGPKTGKSSLLRYLSSSSANARLPGTTYRYYLDAQTLSSTSRPSDFWTKVFRGLSGLVPAGAIADALNKRLGDPAARQVDVYDIEDVFDAFGQANSCAVVLVDDWDLILKNQNYWGDFFHIVRAMHQRQPRGLVFVLATPRRLLDLWADQMGSVYYNIFVSVTLGTMTDEDIAKYVRNALHAEKLQANPAAEQAVIAASDSHPFMVSVVTSLVARQLRDSGDIDATAIGQALQDPNGSLVELNRQIRAELSTTERHWLDTLRKAPQEVSVAQRATLQRLRDYGLLPPGTRL